MTLLPPLTLWPAADVTTLRWAAAFTAAGGLVLLLLARRRWLPAWLPLVGVLAATVDITVVAGAMGTTGSISAGTFYAFATAYAFYYLTTVQAVAVSTLAGAGYALVVWRLGSVAPGAQWLLTVGPVAVVGWVIGGLARERLVTEERSSEELRTVDEHRTLFLRAVSHDMRGPLMTVEGAAETLARRYTDLPVEDRARIAGLLTSGTGRLRQLVENLLTLDRLRSGQVRLYREETDVAGLVADLLDREFVSEPVVLRSAGPVAGWVDRTGVEYAVRNLVGNARKYGPSDDPVEIDVRRQADGITIVVEDRGPGIADDEKESVFEPFVRGAEGAGRSGSGIGLSVVESFARLHGGAVHVEDRRGGGARFVLSLPDEP